MTPSWKMNWETELGLIARILQFLKILIWYLHLSQAVFWKSCHHALSHQSHLWLLGIMTILWVIMWTRMNKCWEFDVGLRPCKLQPE